MATIFQYTQSVYTKAGTPCPKCSGQMIHSKDLYDPNHMQCVQCGYEPTETKVVISKRGAYHRLVSGHLY